MTITAEGLLLGVLLGAVLGGSGATVVALRLAAARRQTATAEATRRGAVELAAARAELETERRTARERAREVAGRDAARDTAMRDSFRALSAEALHTSSEDVSRLAETRMREVTAGLTASTRADDTARGRALSAALDPVAATLSRVEGQLRDAEREREAAFAGLREQVAAVAEGARGVAGETRALTTALRAPHVRGRWGEVQLERVVALAGMVEHVDFTRQAHRAGAVANGGAGPEAGAVRPDLVVHLAGGREVVVDAKVPFAAYLESTEAVDDATRRDRARAHARQVRAHVDALSAKAYWRALATTPEFVVMFVPGEVFLSAALEADPGLLEHAFAADVVLTTPTTLVALLRTVAHAWRQESLAQDAAEIHALGRDLHARLSTLSGHLGKLGRSLDAGVRAFNETVGSWESRVMVTARRFSELAVAGDAPDPPAQVERRARAVATDPPSGVWPDDERMTV